MNQMAQTDSRECCTVKFLAL